MIIGHLWRFLCHNHFTDCSSMELWELPAAGFNFLPDVSLLGDAARCPNCDDRSDAATNMSAVLNDTTHNTATVAYSTMERFCRSDALWSGSPIRFGMFWNLWGIHVFILLIRFYWTAYQLWCQTWQTPLRVMQNRVIQCTASTCINMCKLLTPGCRLSVKCGHTELAILHFILILRLHIYQGFVWDWDYIYSSLWHWWVLPGTKYWLAIHSIVTTAYSLYVFNCGASNFGM